jgi:hypothetical protein
VLHPATGNKIDFILSGDDPWGRMQIRRRRRIFITPELEGFACSPAVVILAKLFCYREGGSEKHLNDIAKMLCRSDRLLDRSYLHEWTGRLGLTSIWEAILNRVNGQ